jgi:hypothetical protein
MRGSPRLPPGSSDASVGTGGSGWEFKSPDGPIKEEPMLLILTIIPLAIGLMIVIMAFLKKLRMRTPAEEIAVSPEIGPERDRSSVVTQAAGGTYRKEEKKEVFR